MRNSSIASIQLSVALAATLTLGGCGEAARLTVAEGMGPQPSLPPPNPSLLPIIDIAPATGWSSGAGPVAADGLTVEPFARDLDHPRWLYVLPNGDVLVAETNAPERPEDGKGIKGAIMGLVMKRAGAATPSADRITLLRDADRDGRPELRTTFVEGLHSPFGMALADDDFYVANTDAIVRFTYASGATMLTAPPARVADLPAGEINHHWTKNVIANADGTRLYATVGSNSNVGENGMAVERQRAAILEIDPATGATTVFASGLRNPNGLAFEPQTNVLWTVVNERDELGSDLVPDYLTSVVRGGFYGWPFSYYGGNIDERIEATDPELVATALVPDYALGPHTASLGLVFYTGETLAAYRGGAFIAQHGSWNRTPPSGYRVIFVPFESGHPSGEAREVLTGFLTDDGDAQGRPVGLAVDATGALLVADDVGNTVWRVTPRTDATARE